MLMLAYWEEKQDKVFILMKNESPLIPQTAFEQTLSSLSFEEAMAQLEGLVRKLEEGRLPLEEAITTYEQGSALKKYCEEKLRQAKLRVDQIMISTTGESTLQPFDSNDA